jgi:hypothetical protein
MLAKRIATMRELRQPTPQAEPTSSRPRWLTVWAKSLPSYLLNVLIGTIVVVYPTVHLLDYVLTPNDPEPFASRFVFGPYSPDAPTLQKFSQAIAARGISDGYFGSGDISDGYFGKQAVREGDPAASAQKRSGYDYGSASGAVLATFDSSWDSEGAAPTTKSDGRDNPAKTEIYDEWFTPSVQPKHSGYSSILVAVTFDSGWGSGSSDISSWSSGSSDITPKKSL